MEGTGQHATATAPDDAAILAAVDAGRQPAIDLLCDLVREPSLLGEEASAQARMAGEYQSLGLEIDRYEMDLAALENLPGYSPALVDYSGRENVVGVHRPSVTRGRSLILNGHIDVVPTGPADMWSAPPFEPVLRDGRLYGRGAGDMKAGLVACVAAFRALQHLGVHPASPVYLQSVIEEECTGNGALACLHRGYRADAAIIPEPFDHCMMSAQLGVMWFSVQVRGRPAHVFEASAGVNAIEAAFEIFQALKRLETEWNDASIRHPAFADHEHPVNFNIGRIEGGEWPSSVPTQCRFDVRIAFYPGADLAEVRRIIEHAVQEAVRSSVSLSEVHAQVEFRGFQAEGCLVDEDAPLIPVLEEAHARVMGSPLARVTSFACTDARFFNLYGEIPATCYGPEASHIHGIDESVSLESMHRVAGVLALFMARWCGLEAIESRRGRRSAGG